jgi:SHS family lactate transporter-like MFS transporter
MTRPVSWWREPTRGQWASFAAAWAGWVLDAFDFTVFLLVMPAIAREFGVSSTAAAGSVTLTLLTRLAGGLLAGTAADRWGRKLPLLVSIAWFACCDAAVAFTDSFAWMLAFRTLFGFGMGAEWTAGATLAMENWPARSRGIASGVLQGSWAVGFILAAQVAALVVPAWGWRALFLVAAAPALVVLPLVAAVPESERWRGARQTAPVDSAHRPPRRERPEEGLTSRVAWAVLLYAFAFGVYYGLSSLYPTLLQTELGRDARGVASHVTLFNLGMMAGAIGTGVVAARAGVVPAIVAPVLMLLPVLPLYVGAAPAWLGAGAFAAGALGAGISGVTPALLTDLFPARVRGRCLGLVYHLGALLASTTPPLVAALAERGRLPLSRSIGLIVGGAALLVVLTMLLRPRSARPPYPE